MIGFKNCGKNKLPHRTSKCQLIMKTRAFLLYSFLMFLTGCNTAEVSRTEIVQKHRDIIVDVSDSIVDIKTEVLFGKSLLFKFRK